MFWFNALDTKQKEDKKNSSKLEMMPWDKGQQTLASSWGHDDGKWNYKTTSSSSWHDQTDGWRGSAEKWQGYSTSWKDGSDWWSRS